MTKRELRSLLSKPESQSIECKPKVISRDKIAEYAVGIGNSGGGCLVMGVTDRIPRTIVPVETSSGEIERIRESVADLTQIHVSVEKVSLDEGDVLVVSIPPHPRGIPFHTGDGKYLIRLGSSLRGMSLAVLDAIRKEAGVEISANIVPGNWRHMASPVAFEELRNLMKEAGAPD
ncbi:MAG: ATP-binding protein, partial [Armatimonadetes bacterium]|nr:ATP-binding protein [Armatimonadota bacterium]